MIELFERDKTEINRKSSKGNQLKWERDNTWYKADYTGYEGLSEYVISHLLKKSTLAESEYVIYEQEQIQYGSQIYQGVSSRNFLKSGEQLITLERLFVNTFGIGLSSILSQIVDHEERLKTLVSKVQDITGLDDFGIYMGKLITIDTLFLNEDRHTHNIAVIMQKNGSYRFCPIFDQGAGLLADTTMDYPLSDDIFGLMDKAEAKTFCRDFDEQLEIAEKLYGKTVSFRFTRKDAEDILSGTSGYEKVIKDRVRDVIFEQMRKYTYLFG